VNDTYAFAAKASTQSLQRTETHSLLLGIKVPITPQPTIIKRKRAASLRPDRKVCDRFSSPDGAGTLGFLSGPALLPPDPEVLERARQTVSVPVAAGAQGAEAAVPRRALSSG